jgi:hypothetical protein
MTLKKLFLCCLLAAMVPLFAAGGVYACDDCDEPGLVDGDEAYRLSFREGRDLVEGFWGIYVDWHPDSGAAKSYRMAIVKNTFGVYPEADYLGVSTCDRPGCKKGEVKLLLSRTDVENEFQATLLTEKGGGGKGKALLLDSDDGRENSALDLQDVKYDGKMMAYWMLRIKGG